jgi:DNA polymerase-1
MGETLVGDCETDGLRPEMTKLHMLQLGALEDTDCTIYADNLDPAEVARAREGVMLGDVFMKLTCPLRPLSEGIERVKSAEMSYWHSGLTFDLHAVNRFHPGTLDRMKMRDTVVMARLLTKEMNNKLEAWGRRLNCHKGDFSGPWDRVTAEMLVYSSQDVAAGRALTKHLLKLLPGSEAALSTEQSVQYWIDCQEHTGFHLNEPECRRLYGDLLAHKAELEISLRQDFPARWTKTGDVTPKTSNSRWGYYKGAPFSRVIWDEFSPGSRQAIAERLIEKGWRPTEKTKTGLAKVDEEILVRLAKRFFPATRLAAYFTATKSIGLVGSWLEACRGGRVHGRVNPLGTYTGRMSHSKPNMAQIPKTGPWRALWTARPGWKLVGCDGEGIQARVLAHYLSNWDHGVFADRVANGRKEDASDIHSANRDAIWSLFPPDMPKGAGRDTVKNLLYALVFNAQDPRLGITLKEGCIGYAKIRPPSVPNAELGAAIRRNLEKAMKGLSKLQDLVEETFKKRGHVRGLDGRKLFPNRSSNAFMTIIQGGEAVIMKTALVIFCDEIAPREGLRYDIDWAKVADIHDEWQFEAPPETAEIVGRHLAWCIAEAGRRLNLKCAFAGEYKVGDNWAATH